jgi:uncharacterized repeat protein (TIGR01451 family)/LPXTG-motif cell wall-anchored protein
MSKIMSLIRRAPKRFSLLVAIVAAAIIVPAVTFAWGPDRPVFTGNTPATYPVFNSMTDNPVVGDERNFVRIRESGTGNYTNQVNFEAGKVYEVSVYYHNNAASNLNESGKGQAKDATLKMEVPNVVTAGVNAALTGTISASNTNPLKVWDEAYGKNTTNADIALRYVSGTARFTSQGAINGQTVPDTLFTTGAKLGYSAQNGEVPGCNQYSGYVTFKIRVDQPGFTIKKEVSTDGKTWVDDSVKAAPGSTVQYRLSYQNTGTNQQDNVVLRDILPTGVTYVNGSSLIANSTTGGQYKTAVDGVAGATGTNVGSYQPGGNVYFKFSAKLPNVDALKCGSNSLNNVLRVTTNAGYKEDNATVVVDRECKPTVKYTCDALKVETINRTNFKFTTDYTVQNATFKSVTYVIKNANGTTVDTKTSTSKTLDYTQTTVGSYTVQATVTVMVDGATRTVTSDACKASFSVPQLPGDITVCELATKKIVTIKESAFDASKYSKDLSKCAETPVTPPELPHTGATENIVAIIGLGALIASIAYYVASRRALNQ